VHARAHYLVIVGPRTSRLAAMGGALLLATGMTGCITSTTAPIQAGPVHTTTPTVAAPTPTPAPVPSYVLISTHSVSVVTRDNHTIVDIPFSTEISAAASQLSTALTEQPSVTAFPETSCEPAHNSYDWGGLTFYTTLPYREPGDFAFAVTAYSARTAEGLNVFSAGLQQVGTPIAAVVANVPGAIPDSHGVLVDAQPIDSPDHRWGVKLSSFSIPLQGDSDVVTSIIAPVFDQFGHGNCDAGT